MDSPDVVAGPGDHTRFPPWAGSLGGLRPPLPSLSSIDGSGNGRSGACGQPGLGQSSGTPGHPGVMTRSGSACTRPCFGSAVDVADRRGALRLETDIALNWRADHSGTTRDVGASHRVGLEVSEQAASGPRLKSISDRRWTKRVRERLWTTGLTGGAFAREHDWRWRSTNGCLPAGCSVLDALGTDHGGLGSRRICRYRGVLVQPGWLAACEDCGTRRVQRAAAKDR